MNGGIWPPDPSHICEAPECGEPSPTSRACSNSCRAKLWKAEHKYRDPRRGVRNASRRRRRPSGTRYAIVRSEGTHLDVLALDTAASKRSVEAAFGIRDREELFAIAVTHLPVVA